MGTLERCFQGDTDLPLCSESITVFLGCHYPCRRKQGPLISCIWIQSVPISSVDSFKYLSNHISQIVGTPLCICCSCVWLCCFNRLKSYMNSKLLAPTSWVSTEPGVQSFSTQYFAGKLVYINVLCISMFCRQTCICYNIILKGKYFSFFKNYSSGH